MIVLAIDTTSQEGGAGVFRDATALAIEPNTSPANSYSVTLFDLAERAVRKAGISWKDIDLFAASNGPGSFTGIRVGLAAAQAWARAFGRPAIGVSNLRAMAQAACPDAEWAAPIIDARRGEFYLGRFPHPSAVDEDGAADDANEGLVVDASKLKEIIQSSSSNGTSKTAWVIRASDSAASELRGSLESAGEWLVVQGPLLTAIAAIALRRHASGENQAASLLQPCYIRRPDAELNWRG